jgi:phospholipase C
MTSVRCLLVPSLMVVFAAVFGDVAYGQSCSALADKTVNICSPAAGAMINSPVQFTAAARDDEHPITGMILYVDSVIHARSSNGLLSASVALAAGQHAIVIRAWDSTGFFFSSSERITVTTAAPPTVTISANPTQISQGQSSTITVTAQNASQVAVTNNVDSTSQQLASSGGTFSVSPARTTTYTATATASSGAKATASATVTVGTTGDITAINHVIFMLQENRSFDSYFGMLNPYRKARGWNVGDDGHQYDVDGIDDKLTTISNQDDEGASFSLFHSTSTCLDDMSSAWLESYGDVSRWDFTPSRPIVMDGFVHTAENFAKSGAGSGQFTDLTGERAMAFYADMDSTGVNPELNYYYFMASQFTLSDRWFSPVSSKTIPNRLATISGGTSQGYVFDPGTDDQAPQLAAKTIFELLDNNHISWRIYYSHTDADGSPSTAFRYFTYSNHFIFRDSSGTLVVDSLHIAPLSQYFTDAQNGTLPQFAYIEPNFGTDDEHPGSGQSILAGQQEVASIINQLMFSPSWTDSVFFFAFDEGGGPYDHVPPVPGQTNKYTSPPLANLEGDIGPIAVNPDGFFPCVPQTPGVFNNHCDLRPDNPGAQPGDAAAQSGFAAQLGFRIPNIIVSPFARKHYVGHTAMDHTAVIRFLEARFNLPALTKRDAIQPNLLDFFDFTNKPWATPPAQAQVPTPPPVGSTCHAASFK